MTKSTLCCLIFFGNLCFVQDLAPWSTIGLVREYNGLYLLEESNSTSTCISIAISVNKVQPHVLHSRLGHLSNAKLALVNDDNVPSFKSNENFHCDVCPLDKQKRLPFKSSTHVSDNCFDIIHCDLWGPFSVSKMNGYRFFLTIVDDCSKCTWVYLLKHKS